MKKDYAIRMIKLLWFLLASLVVWLVGCSSENPASPVPAGGQYFTVQAGKDSFVMYVTDQNSIRLATENFQGKNKTFPSGRIERGHGGHNWPWNWHFIPQSIRMVEASIEVCDGAPSYVEDHVNDYVAIGYCPWGAKVIKVGR
jgi:hypothetical protein